MKLFAVIRTRGDAWNHSVRLEEQPGWDEHAAFMNGLQREGFIAIGGPLEGTTDVLLIMRAASPDKIVKRLQDDPWTRSGLLRLGRISEWTLRLGSLA
jgi:uncharacterized protein YciI